MELAGVITGAVALIISVILAWKNYLSPFRPGILCGNPRLEPLPLKLENGSKVTRFSAILPLCFTNSGAREGDISDIVLLVHSDQNEWLFQPFFYTQYSMKTESTLGAGLTDGPSNEPFYPIHLPGKGTVYKPILFALLKHEQFPLGTSPLSPGKYSFILKTLEADRKHHRTKLVFNVTLNSEEINQLSAGACLIPFLDEVKRKREELHR
jgi:hypothetical protein